MARSLGWGGGATLPHMPLADAGAFLTRNEIHDLRRKSSMRGALLVLHAWGVVALAMAAFALWPNPLTLLLGVMVVGARQLGLAILMHDAAHGLLLSGRRLNDWVGRWLCGAPAIASMDLYRPYHLTHHRRTQQPDDPDLGLSAPFPITRASLRRKLVRDLTGRTAYQRRRLQLRDALGPHAWPWRRRIARATDRIGAGLLVNALMLVTLSALGHWYLYIALWLLPLATWYQLISRIRNIAEHAVVPDNDDPLLNTRTTHAGWIERAFIAPYFVNYHLEHHLFLFVPCWRLPETHRVLVGKGLGSRMEIQPGYRAMLRLATSATRDTHGGTPPMDAQYI
jgi:fatty acid desaturase